MATDRISETIDNGDVYLVAGVVRRQDGNSILIVTGLNGEHALRVKNSEVVRLDALSTVAYVDSSIATLIGLAASIFQPLDATITAIAGLTTAGDRLQYWTGVDTAALATFTEFARTLLDDANAATMRTTLGLAALSVLSAVGTAEITDAAVTLAKLQTISTDRLLGRATAGTGVVEQITCTPAARTVLDDTSTAAMLTTLGAAASVHTHTGTQVTLDDATWVGALAGSGIRDVQDLANWLDANLP